MDKTLIIPVAGKSSRFKDMRPKWLLTMPDGSLMIEKSVSKLNMKDFSQIIIVCLREHLDKYLTSSSFEIICSNLGHKNVRAIILDRPTNSQSETVCEAIRIANIKGPIYIKDCDNEFSYNFSGDNEISIIDLNKIDLVDAKSKSYVKVDRLGMVTNIVEKNVISNIFCCGGYGFSDAQQFFYYSTQIESNSEKYISHVIYRMILDGHKFVVREAANYSDWGTIREFRHYQKSFITLFCDIDGVLFYNGSKFGPGGWATKPIAENLKTIRYLKERGCLYLVITSSRPISEKKYVEDYLLMNGVKVDQFVMGLPHTRRILINDYSKSNPYPAAFSINLHRDHDKLSLILDSLIS